MRQHVKKHIKTDKSIMKIKRKVAPEKPNEKESRYPGFLEVAQAFLNLNNPQTMRFETGSKFSVFPTDNRKT